MTDEEQRGIDRHDYEEELDEEQTWKRLAREQEAADEARARSEWLAREAAESVETVERDWQRAFAAKPHEDVFYSDRTLERHSHG